tara:strand:+ start:689 stop:994 length:306 start_codon:yes stop_codon:yes gene_type:complete
MANTSTEKQMVWNVYFRRADEDWQLQRSIPPIIVETFEKNGKTAPGNEWYGDHETLDLSEGRAAMLVLQNQTLGLESTYKFEERTHNPRNPVPVIFNCTLR